MFTTPGDMLEHFLMNGGYRTVTLPYNTSFASDLGIRRAIYEKIPSDPDKVPDEPKEITPLLYEFLNDIQAYSGCDKSSLISPIIEYGWETYSGEFDPRPHGMGWWGAFGHVVIDAEYTNIKMFPTYGNNGYVVKTQVKYSVEDHYEWFGGLMKTPLPLGTPDWDAGYFPPVVFVYIPHEWEDSLVNAGKATEYDFSITWSEYMQIVVLKDFSNFMIVGEGKWLPLK